VTGVEVLEGGDAGGAEVDRLDLGNDESWESGFESVGGGCEQAAGGVMGRKVGRW
jgi:hypothetical protein